MTSTFPAGFLLGSATAAYQIEGAVAEGGRGASIWDTFTRTPGTITGGDTGDVACDHYHRWESDVEMMVELGLEAYRFSIAWPRVQPAGTGAFNPEGIAFYRRLVERLVERGITPMVTLYHWDLPQALEDSGGWLSRDTIDAFVVYATRMVEELGDLVTHWATFNEPWVSSFVGYATGSHAPGRVDDEEGLTAAHHLLLSHARAYRAIKETRPDLQVGIVNNSHTPRPWDPSNPADRAASAHIDALANGMFHQPFLDGTYPEVLRPNTAHLTDWSFVHDGDLEEMRGAVDWFGLNYYASHVVRHNPAKGAATSDVATLADGHKAGSSSPWPGDEEIEFMRPPGELTAMGWNIDPGALTAQLLRLQREAGLPIYVTENGSAWDDQVDGDGRIRDRDRTRYLRAHLQAVLDAIDEGADVRGYMAWSLMDNFEWAQGYAKRFGIVHVDYDTQVRTWKDTAYWYREAIRARGIVPLEAGEAAAETPPRTF
ncbi:glycoside hydrolase family 1 protein [Demequina lignilytica]|uniref:Family 1 glycosylhydrolase n=1 Tax=Demequina lignilytica TaxID=3051663 RepID=A0AB35MFN3_9MICO|nr:family 1 glycosylhydrolase [Demequina sp. SYSU T0a273]MDN4482551.1 family 1 glycosylhydrolase [Demequina sp. SYSU T0a273]